MSERTVSEMYKPEIEGHQIIDIQNNEYCNDWGIGIAQEVDADGGDVPVKDEAGNFRGNTAIFTIPEGGSTGAIYVCTENHMKRFAVSVLSGEMRLIKAYESGYIEDILLGEGDSVEFKMGQSCFWLNEGKEDALLRSEVYPAYEPGDTVHFNSSLLPTEERLKEREFSTYFVAEKPNGERVNAQLSNWFFKLVGYAEAGLELPESKIPLIREEVRDGLDAAELN